MITFLKTAILTDFNTDVFAISLITFSFLHRFNILLATVLVTKHATDTFATRVNSVGTGRRVSTVHALNLSPVRLLIIPHILTLLMTLPVLAFLTVLSKVVNNNIIYTMSLKVSPTVFLSLLRASVNIRRFLIKVIGTPVFTFLVTTVNYLRNFGIDNDTRSINTRAASDIIRSVFIIVILSTITTLFFVRVN